MPLADIVVAYYQKLRDLGLGISLAEKLTVDYHSFLLQRMTLPPGETPDEPDLGFLHTLGGG